MTLPITSRLLGRMSPARSKGGTQKRRFESEKIHPSIIFELSVNGISWTRIIAMINSQVASGLKEQLELLTICVLVVTFHVLTVLSLDPETTHLPVEEATTTSEGRVTSKVTCSCHSSTT